MSLLGAVLITVDGAALGTTSAWEPMVNRIVRAGLPPALVVTVLLLALIIGDGGRDRFAVGSPSRTLLEMPEESGAPSMP
jgi:hypothetical protein